MKSITNLMINEWNIKKICWMGYKVSKENPYTYHHIKKRCVGGEESIENGAILTKIAHEYLHILETRDLEKYIYINNVLKQINEQGFMPLERQLLAINSILEEFERENKYEKSKKGKMLIKKEYIEGRIVNDGVFRENKRH